MISRRNFLKSTAYTLAAGTIGAAAVQQSATANAAPILGTVIDFSAHVPNASAIREAGHMGAIRYVSERRPGAEWMLGKPVTLNETRAMATEHLHTASVYQFGKAETADWKAGAAGALTHAPQAIALHFAAGGPTQRPIYVAIDDNPTRDQYVNQIRPYLESFKNALAAASLQMGVYGNYSTIEWAINDGLGEFYWQHDWGSQGKLHPRAHVHQKAGYRAHIDGVEVDINNVYAADWGQWLPGNIVVPPNTDDAPNANNNASTDSISTLIRALGTSSS
ncbi:DUF1906 domain-containing protein [Corynebacterium freiburgense]|uniref:DUF1906 domain-containing protein n=1 Tax=Corynebacterium freiburgense TaxID=556548 RepID=UPI000402B082|nr:DUF1906 domain-containing protein [Corynebacterium freiburgense]WJZ02041.1 hypothetical protein CFREI_03705 [Corynebacterium freiburgense]